MDSTILLFLLQDGVTNGAIYALLALALVLVFAVTRVIFIPQGEFVAYGALTLALLSWARCRARSALLVRVAALALRRAWSVGASRRRRPSAGGPPRAVYVAAAGRRSLRWHGGLAPLQARACCRRRC